MCCLISRTTNSFSPTSARTNHGHYRCPTVMKIPEIVHLITLIYWNTRWSPDYDLSLYLHELVTSVTISACRITTRPSWEEIFLLMYDGSSDDPRESWQCAILVHVRTKDGVWKIYNLDCRWWVSSKIWRSDVTFGISGIFVIDFVEFEGRISNIRRTYRCFAEQSREEKIKRNVAWSIEKSV